MALEKRKEGRRKRGIALPCAACRLLRRRCVPECLFAPYFPAGKPEKFANVHKVFGASNVSKMLQDLPVQQRADAVSSMVYEAKARLKDPVYGCVATISSLQHQIDALQNQLAIAQAQVVHMRMQEAVGLATLAKNSIESSSSLPSKLMTRTWLTPDVIGDQNNLGESLWSC